MQHTHSEVLNTEINSCDDSALVIEKGVSHKPFLPVHSIVSSCNLGSSKIQATVEVTKGFYFIPKVVRVGGIETQNINQLA